MLSSLIERDCNLQFPVLFVSCPTSMPQDGILSISACLCTGETHVKKGRNGGGMCVLTGDRKKGLASTLHNLITQNTQVIHTDVSMHCPYGHK